MGVQLLRSDRLSTKKLAVWFTLIKLLLLDTYSIAEHWFDHGYYVNSLNSE